MHKLAMYRPERILIVKLSAIGYVVHALPVAHALEENFPRAEISWIVEDKAQEILAGNPCLDQVIILPRREWAKGFKNNKLQTLKEIKDFFIALRKKRFDLAIDLQGLFKSGLITWLSGARLRLGYSDSREGSTLFYNRKVTPPPENIPVVERYLELLKPLGVERVEAKFDIAVSGEDKAKIDSLFAFYAIKPQDRLIAINPFTSWHSKNWLSGRYAELGDKLIAEAGYKVIFTGGPADQEGIDRILGLMDREAYNLAGETSLKELAELYSRVYLFIGGDTGPMHLAAAMGVPVIALMGPTDPARNGPYGTDSIVIQKDLRCKNCWKRECPKLGAEREACMKQIEVDEVFRAVKEIMERR